MGIVTCFSSSVWKLLFLSNPRRRWWASEKCSFSMASGPWRWHIGRRRLFGFMSLPPPSNGSHSGEGLLPPPPPQCSFSLGWVSPSQGTSRLDSFTASSLPPFSREAHRVSQERTQKAALDFWANSFWASCFSRHAPTFCFPSLPPRGCKGENFERRVFY